VIAEKIVGLITAAVAAASGAAVAESSGLSLGLTIVISLVSGGVMGGAAYGAMHTGLRATNHRVSDEVDNRKEAIADLKADVNLGFERIEKTMERQTQQLIAAFKSGGDN
jgi:hypothetical protein